MGIFRHHPLTTAQIVRWLQDLRGNAYVPESNFDVTAILRAQIGGDATYYFGGVNVENVDHRMGTHGEEGAIAASVTALGKYTEIAEVWFMGAPLGMEPTSPSPLVDNLTASCGKCRQQIVNLATGPDIPMHCVSLKGDIETTTLRQLLPKNFSFRDIAPELAHAHSTRQEGLALPDTNIIERRLSRMGPLNKKEICAWLHELQSIDFATQIGHSVIIGLSNGHYVAGVKVEEAAYIDISAIQSAVAIASAMFGRITITQVWSFTRGRDGEMGSQDFFAPLTLASLQILSEFTPSLTHLAIYLVNQNGVVETQNLKNL